ncbi:MAG: hypothetical protein IPK77_02395 [Cellvibrio sp.]|nr:hypothetical protein [Cellvibrio sp.]
MNHSFDSVNNILTHHPLKALFNTHIRDYDSGRVVLELKTLDQFADIRRLRGTFGCIVDCLACIAGRDSIGDCSVSEYEINFHSSSFSHELVASASIEYSNTQCATYSCSIYAKEDSQNRLIAESQGTLFKN